MARWADALTWWLAGWKPGPRPVSGAVVALAVSLAVAAFWVWLPALYADWPVLSALGDLLERFGLRPGWRVTLYLLCLLGALAQAAIAATDLFTPGAIRWRAGARALADFAAALFAVGLVLGFGLNPLEAFESGFQIGAWAAVVFCLSGAGQAVRSLANLRQALRTQAAPAPAVAA